jgi:hypothetical protein
MITDLDRFLQIHSEVSEQQIPCLVLVKTAETPSQGSTIHVEKETKDSNSSPFRNFSSLAEVIHFINSYYPGLPLTINEAGSDIEPVKICLRNDSTQTGLPGLRKALSSQGYDLISEQKLVPMLVIRKNRASNIPSLSYRSPEDTRGATETLAKRPD